MNPYLWLAIAAVMAVAELLSQGLITIWFVVGGIAAFFAGFLGADMVVQIVVFLVVSLACLTLFRPLVMKHRKIGAAHDPTLIGTRAIVTERIGPNELTGRVETPDRMTWTALSADGTPIEVGTNVSVVSQQSIKLVVTAEPR